MVSDYGLNERVALVTLGRGGGERGGEDNVEVARLLSSMSEGEGGRY